MKFKCLNFIVGFVIVTSFALVLPVYALDIIDIHAVGCGSGRVLKDTFTKVNKGSTEYEACADSVDLFQG